MSRSGEARRVQKWRVLPRFISSSLRGGCTAFAKKLVLTKRILWFDGPKAAPSFNHAWYLWDHHHRPPTIVYA
jgi:hypothetical protein